MTTETICANGASTAFTMTEGWRSAPSIPTRCFKILKISNTQFIAINTKDTWVYDNSTDTWIGYNPLRVHPGANDCCMDYENKTLWFITDHSIIKFKNGESSVHHLAWNIMDTSVCSSLLIIDSSLHIIGGSDNTKHYKLDENFSLQCLYDFRTKLYWNNGNYYHGLVHIKSRKQLLLFGGFELGPRGRSNEMFSYSLKSNAWKKLDTTLSVKSNAFGYIMTMDETKLIIFGGNTNYSMSSDIFIMSLDSKSVQKSSLLCPDTKNTTFDAVLLNQANFDELLVSAYLHFGDDTNNTLLGAIPLDVVRLILKLSSTYYVHLVTLCNSKHWKIPLDVILGWQ